MISVITGDIINSKSSTPGTWLARLKKELQRLGKAPRTWEIYRGDSFQAIVDKPEEALLVAMKLKAALKSLHGINVRMAIGIGTRTYIAARVTESNGTAFVNSGEQFETLRHEKQDLAVKSDWPEFDREINLYLRLALIPINNWTVNTAEIVSLALAHPNKSQEQLGRMIGIKQSAISTRLARAYFEELMEVEGMYRAKLKTLQ